ncbi:MAG TPA: c-type cytochrome [Longimicrobiales bacterium]|nr:c-type cytochrome [Longimicrobiales bacterium]
MGASRLGLALVLALGLAGCGEARGGPTPSVPGGSATRGRVLLGAYGCVNCHMIPGVEGANGTVGPPLIVWSRRTYIAGALPNTPDNLIRWIQNPQAIEPGTAMPYLGVSRAQAADMAAYLYTLE